MSNNTTSEIQYIGAKYGVSGVSRFVGALTPSASLTDAFRNGLQINPPLFEVNWQTWLKNKE